MEDLKRLKQELIDHAKNLTLIKDELLALRAWKAKARPFLERTLNNFKILMPYPDPKTDDEKLMINELTELLGGEDERNN